MSPTDRHPHGIVGETRRKTLWRLLKLHILAASCFSLVAAAPMHLCIGASFQIVSMCSLNPGGRPRRAHDGNGSCCTTGNVGPPAPAEGQPNDIHDDSFHGRSRCHRRPNCHNEPRRRPLLRIYRLPKEEPWYDVGRAFVYRVWRMPERAKNPHRGFTTAIRRAYHESTHAAPLVLKWRPHRNSLRA